MSPKRFFTDPACGARILLTQTPGDRIRPEEEEDQPKTKNQMSFLEPHCSSKDILSKNFSEILRNYLQNLCPGFFFSNI
jgi:hypothetical protein